MEKRLTPAMIHALHRLACEVVDWNPEGEIDCPECETPIPLRLPDPEDVSRALSDLRKTGWRAGLLGADR